MFGWKKKGKAEEGTAAVKETPVKTEVAEEQSLPEKIKVKVKDRTGCSVAMAIEVPVGGVRQEMEKAYARVRNKVKMPGFRPGKAPLDMVKKNFQGVAWEEAVDHLLRESVVEAMIRENLSPVGTPEVEKVDGAPDKPFRFEVKVECAPAVVLKDYKGLPLSVKKKPVTEAEVDERLAGLREGNAKLVLSKDGVVGDKHFVVVDYETILDGKPLPDGKATGQLIEMAAPQNVAGFTEGLRGAKDGETREVPVTFPAEHPNRNVAGKTVQFKISVTAIKEKELPALDDDFARDLGMKDLAELRGNVRSDLEAGRRRAERQDLEKQIVNGLLAWHPFEVPASQARERAKQLTEQMKRFLMERGATESDWASNEPKLTEKNLPEAERQVRLSYILGRILDAEKMAVTDEDLDAHLNTIVEASRPDQKSQVRDWMNARRETVRAQLREERLFDFLIQHANVTETAAERSGE